LSFAGLQEIKLGLRKMKELDVDSQLLISKA